MHLTLPMNYVELEQEEMMNLDGGWQNYIFQMSVEQYYYLQIMLLENGVSKLRRNILQHL